MAPPPLSCTNCGAALSPPRDPEQRTVTCRYCGTVVPLDDPSRSAVAAAERMRAGVERSLAAHAASQRRLLLVFGAVALGLVGAAALLLGPLRTPAGDAVEAGAGRPSTTAPAPLASMAPAPPPSSPATATARGLPVVASFGGPGTGPGRFDRARHLATSPSGDVYVADRTNRVQRFDAQGSWLDSFVAQTKNRPRGPLSNDIEYVIGLAVDHAGNVYVSLGYDVQVFTAAPEFKLDRVVRGVPGKLCYRDLAFDQSEQLYVRSHCSDEHVNAIVKLAKTGAVLKRIEEPATFERASTGRVAVDGTGNLYAPRGYEYEILVLTPQGDVKTRIGRQGNAPGEFPSTYLGALAFDRGGTLHALHDGLVDRFDPTGRHLGALSLGEGCHPRDFSFAPDGDLWLLCSNAERVEKRAVATAGASAG